MKFKVEREKRISYHRHQKQGEFGALATLLYQGYRDLLNVIVEGNVW